MNVFWAAFFYLLMVFLFALAKRVLAKKLLVKLTAIQQSLLSNGTLKYEETRKIQ
jgi:hypothetical protein